MVEIFLGLCWSVFVQGRNPGLVNENVGVFYD